MDSNGFHKKLATTVLFMIALVGLGRFSLSFIEKVRRLWAESNGANASDKLRALLAEYNTLRREILSRIRLQVTIMNIYLVFLPAFYWFVLTSRKFFLLLILGPIAGGFLALWVFEHRLIVLISTYILEEIEEKKLSELFANPFPNHPNWRLMGWQHYYGAHLLSIPRYVIALTVWLVLIGILPSIAACLLVLSNNLLGPLSWMQRFFFVDEFEWGTTVFGTILTAILLMLDAYSLVIGYRELFSKQTRALRRPTAQSPF